MEAASGGLGICGALHLAAAPGAPVVFTLTPAGNPFPSIRFRSKLADDANFQSL